MCQQRSVSLCRGTHDSRHELHLTSVQREVTQSHARRPVHCRTLAVRFSSLSVVMFSFASGVLELRLPPRGPSWARQMSACLVSASYSMASPGSQHSRHRSNLSEQVISFMSRVSGPSNSVLPDEKPFSTRPPTERILHVCRRSQSRPCDGRRRHALPSVTRAG